MPQQLQQPWHALIVRCCRLQGRWIKGYTWKNLTANQVCVYNCDVTMGADEYTNKVIAQYKVTADRAAEGKTAGCIITEAMDQESEKPLLIITIDRSRQFSLLHHTSQAFSSISSGLAQA